MAHLWVDAISAILHFELNEMPGPRLGRLVLLLFIAILIATIWFKLRP